MDREEHGDTWSPEEFYNYIDSPPNKAELDAHHRAFAARDAQEANHTSGPGLQP
jgi:hypothetical protein